MNIAIIPARGGSKRIKKKNIKIFFNKPILHYTYDIIKKLKIFDKIILSTDDENIIKIGKKIGFDIIHKRSKKNSQSNSTTIEAVKECLKKLKISSNNNLCCIYPCSIFVTKKDILRGFQLLKKHPNHFVYPLKKFSHPIERAVFLTKSNNVRFLYKQNSNKKTQSFSNSFFDAGQFYWGKTKKWLESNDLHFNAKGFEVKNYQYVDIDTEDDWELAKIIFVGNKKLKKN